jgi:hypothetical protein
MRQGNSKQRMRGRGGNSGVPSRKGPNPLSRTYESTGPDVKIRGTALHIAEKYVSLARDAHSSGDPVLSENYLQHAEHYYRIIAAAQAQLPQAMSIVRSDLQTDDEDDDGGDSYQETRFDPRPQDVRAAEQMRAETRSFEAPRPEQRSFEPARPEPRNFEPRGEPRVTEEGIMPIDAPQPFLDDSPAAERAREERRPVADRAGGERTGGERGRGRGFRNGPRGDAPRGDAPREGAPREGGNRFEGRPPRERHPRGEGREPARVADDAGAASADAGLDQLPAFLMTPTPRPAPVAPPAPAAPVVAADEVPAADAGEATPRRRARGGRGRGRRTDLEGGEIAGETTVAVDE